MLIVQCSLSNMCHQACSAESMSQDVMFVGRKISSSHWDHRVLKGPGGVQGEGVFLGNPKDSVWEDWGTLGNLREH